MLQCNMLHQPRLRCSIGNTVMSPYAFWLAQWQLYAETVRISVAAGTTISARLAGMALGDTSELWRMAAEKPKAFAHGHLRAMRALGNGKDLGEATRAGLRPIRVAAERNARRLSGRPAGR